MAEKDSELLSSLGDARDLVDNGVKALGTGHIMEAHETLCDRLKDILKIGGPDLSEATSITKRGEGLYFNKKHVDLDLGDVEMGEVKWVKKISVELSKNMCGTAPTPDGRMAVGSNEGGIEIYSAEGELQQTALEDVCINRLAFLSDGRCVVLDYDVSLYTPEWEKLDVKVS